MELHVVHGTRFRDNVDSELITFVDIIHHHRTLSLYSESLIYHSLIYHFAVSIIQVLWSMSKSYLN
jgi:hypothetical protein